MFTRARSGGPGHSPIVLPTTSSHRPTVSHAVTLGVTEIVITEMDEKDEDPWVLRRLKRMKVDEYTSAFVLNQIKPWAHLASQYVQGADEYKGYDPQERRRIMDIVNQLDALPSNVGNEIITINKKKMPYYRRWKRKKRSRRRTSRRKFKRRKKSRFRRKYRKGRRGSRLMKKILDLIAPTRLLVESSTAEVTAASGQCVYAAWDLADGTDLNSCIEDYHGVGDGNEGIFFRKMLGIYNFTNQTTFPVVMTLYHCMPRTNIPGTRGNIPNIIREGFDQVISVGDGELDPTLNLYDNQLFCRYFKILKNCNVYMQPGHMYRYIMKNKRHFKHTDAEEDDSAVKYFRKKSQILVMRIQGMVAQDVTDSTSVSTAIATISTTSIRKYWFNGLLENGDAVINNHTDWSTIVAEAPTDEIVRQVEDEGA